MTQVRILSGFNGKAPAAIWIEHQGMRLLLDAGGELDATRSPRWWADLPPVDAILISHDHVDHLNGLEGVPENTPVWCTALVAEYLPVSRRKDWNALPLSGVVDVGGIQLTCGANGHSLGGIWLHLDIAGGLFYSGDFSVESVLYRFDSPPPARTLLLDASYGLYQQRQSDCRDVLLEQISRHSGRTLLPVPPSGRALELALLAQSRGIIWSFDDQCSRAWKQAISQPADYWLPGVGKRLSMLYPSSDVDDCQLLLAGDADGQGGLAKRIITAKCTNDQVIYTGYLPSQARQDVIEERARWQRWNVHPCIQDLIRLADEMAAERVIPLFTPVSDNINGWRQALGTRLTLQSALTLSF